MSMEYFYRGSWRAVSAGKARLLRAKGYRVREAGGEKLVAKIVKVTERAPTPPPPPWPTQPKTIEQPHGLRINPAAPPLGLTLNAADVQERAHADLTDEELERLTAPDGE